MNSKREHDPSAALAVGIGGDQGSQLGLLTKHQVKEMLGFESRFEVDALFKAYDVRDHHFTMEELERGRATMAALLDKR